MKVNGKYVKYIYVLLVIILVSFIYLLFFKRSYNNIDNKINPSVGNLSKEPNKKFDCGAINCFKKVKGTDF